MGGSTHQVSPDGNRNKGIAELNKDKHDENKEVRVRDGIMGEGQGLSDEDESRINKSAMDMNDGHGGGAVTLLALQAGLQKQQQQQQQQMPPGPVFLWERILPVRTLKVLLVENDDSTRQVVSALLRNCSYEVTATANGLQSWKILENPTNHIDLVLTEVVMPGLSGIGLLSKIMSNDTCKNIPVIMMSSNDSMGTVFKCLSKGAVDFLVKPIRKNELKNLWQHVWRRSHSSSGSASESGIQTQKSAKSRSADDCDNNSSSNDEDDNASIGLNARDGSDHGSGTQNSWTKHAVEVDSPQPMSPSDQLADLHDSTCAQVISDSEIYCNKWVSMSVTRECQEQKKHADEFMGKDFEIGVPRNPDIHPEAYPTEKTSTKLIGVSVDKQPENEQKNEDMLGLESSNAFNEPGPKAANLIGGIGCNSHAQLLYHVTDSKDNINNNSVELPSLHLSLKKLRSTGEGGSASHEVRNILKRSNQSAFSRYRTSAVSTQAPTGYVGSCSPIDNSSGAVKTESTHNVISNSNPATLNQGSNGSSNNNDKGSTTKNVYTNSLMASKSIHSSAFHLVQPRTSQQPVHEKIGNKLDGTQFEYQVQHHHHHYHHHVQQPQQKPSSACVGPVEGKAANYSQNGSNSGSNHGSNVQNVNTGVNMETAGFVEKCGVGCGNGSGCGSGSGVDQNRLTQREAALNKFRQKRKERNFGKKVRYQSRKRLAEQRPRVRGQFVRQNTLENTSTEADS